MGVQKATWMSSKDEWTEGIIAPIVIRIAKNVLSSSIITGLPLEAFALACWHWSKQTYFFF